MDNKHLTDKHKRLIKVMYGNGFNAPQIAKKLGVRTNQVSGYIAYYHLAGKQEREIMEKESSIKKEIPPIYKSECKTIVSNNKMLVEDYLKRFGKKIEPIKMSLSEASKAMNLNGKIIGVGFYRNNRLWQI